MVLSRDAALLTGRSAVVTGAAAGIGRACALALAAYGADVAACDRDAAGLATLADEVEQLGHRCVTAVCDVRDVDQVDDFARRTEAQLGRVDVLVHNAGGGFQAPFATLSAKGAEVLVRENLLSVVWVTRAFLPHLSAGGSVVALTSVEAHRAAPGFAVYAAAKAGVASLVSTLALELGERGIRVNAVAPDLIPTPGVGDLAGATSPLGRVGTVDEVAAAVLFLAGDLAGFVTGSTLHVDGGTAAAGGWHRGPDGGWRA